jgi:hypothetical protein
MVCLVVTWEPSSFIWSHRQANGKWGSILHFPPASYIIWNFWLVNHSACHQLSHWYLARLIRPWRWRQICSSEMSVDFQWTTQRYIPEDSALHVTRKFENLHQFSYWKVMDMPIVLVGVLAKTVMAILVINITVLSVVTPCNFVHGYQCLRGTSCVHLQDKWDIKQTMP